MPIDTTDSTETPALKNSPKTAQDYLDELLVEHKNWTATDSGSRKARYVHAGNLLRFHNRLCEQTTEGEALRDEFETYLTDKGLRFNKKTALVVKVVRAIDNTDRRRYTELGRALGIAIAEGITPEQLPDVLHKAGGIHKLRLKAKPNKRARNARKGSDTWNALKATTAVAVVNSPALTALSDLANVDRPIVLLATELTTGVFAIYGVVTATKAVETAYAAYDGQVPAIPQAANDTEPADDIETVSAALIEEVEAQA